MRVQENIMVHNLKNIVLQNYLVDTRDLILSTLTNGFHNRPEHFLFEFRENEAQFPKQKLLLKHPFGHVKRL